MILSNMAWRLRVRRSRLLQIDSNEKQELVYEGTAAPALWFNMLFLNHLGDSVYRKVGIKRKSHFLIKIVSENFLQKSYKELLTTWRGMLII